MVGTNHDRPKRQELVRSVLERIVVTVTGTTETVTVERHWAGGYRTRTSSAGQWPAEPAEHYDALLARVAELRRARSYTSHRRQAE